MRIGIVLISMTAAIWMTGCKTTPEGTNAATSSPNTQVYTVYGMDCPGCHGGLEKNVEKIPGVTGAVANWKDQQVTIFVEDPQSVTSQQVAQAVENSNFTMGERIQ